jgi:hypothetical protein
MAVMCLLHASSAETDVPLSQELFITGLWTFAPYLDSIWEDAGFFEDPDLINKRLIYLLGVKYVEKYRFHKKVKNKCFYQLERLSMF